MPSRILHKLFLHDQDDNFNTLFSGWLAFILTKSGPVLRVHLHMVGFRIMKKYNCLNIETELQALGPLYVVDQRRSTRPQNIILQHLQNFHCRTTNGICCQKHPLLELDHTSSLSVSKE